MGDKKKPVKKPKRVLLDKKLLREKNVTKAEKEIDVPELNQLMGLGDGDVAFVKIQQLTLDQFLQSKMDGDDRLRNLVEGVVAATESRNSVEDEIVASYRGLSPQAQYYVDVCMLGVIDPVLTRPQWSFLARRFPLVVENITGHIILLTKGGADVKKNS